MAMPVKGTDNEERLGPIAGDPNRTGYPAADAWMIAVFVLLSLISGSLLIWFGLRGGNMLLYVLFFLLGFSAIFAAIKYTIGKTALRLCGIR